jgi:sugar phosphate permease
MRAESAISRRLSRRLPFFYGWIVLACLGCAGFSRQAAAVATLSVFVEPLTQGFHWSRAALSGAVSLGGVLAAVASPLIGPALDRHGGRLVLCLAVLVTGLTTMLLSRTASLFEFYALYCIARMNWAGPFDLGIYSTLSKWFIVRRAFATSVANLAQMAGLVAMPLIAEFAMLQGSWRDGWLAIGSTVLVVGFVPTLMFLARRPEDLGLRPDGPLAAASGADPKSGRSAPRFEPDFSRREAMATPSFWLLLLYTVLVYPVQAGVSLHQAPYLIERGIAPAIAATVVSTFSLTAAVGSIACGFLPSRLPIRTPLVLTGAALAAGVFVMLEIATTVEAYIAASLFGLGIGGIMTLLPVAWADYFGRANYGAIRGVVLSAQVLAQAAGPLFSGALRDWTGNYRLSLECFTALAGFSVIAALAAQRPRAKEART